MNKRTKESLLDDLVCWVMSMIILVGLAAVGKSCTASEKVFIEPLIGESE